VELPALLTRTLLFFSPRSRQGSRAFDRRHILEPAARNAIKRVLRRGRHRALIAPRNGVSND